MPRESITTEKEKWEEAQKTADQMCEFSRMVCAPYSLEELMEFMRQGKNPLLGDKL